MTIQDDTNLTLADQVNFQTVDVEPTAGDDFANRVAEEYSDKRPLHESPYLRIGLAVGAIAFVLGFFAIWPGGDKPATVSVEDAESDEQELSLTLDPEASGSDSAELEALRTEVALLEQQVALAQVDRSDARESTSTATPQPETSRTTTRTTTRPNSTATQATSRPARSPSTAPVSSVAVRTPPRPAPRVTPVSRPAAVRSATPTSAPPAQLASRSYSPPATNYTPPDPNEEWARLSNAGMVGMMPEPDVNEDATAYAYGNDVDVQVASKSVEPEYQLKNASFISIEIEESDSVEMAEAEAVPGLWSDTDYIPLGSRAQGEVATPIVWALEDQQSTIEVIEDVTTVNGDVMVPAGAYLIVQPVQVDRSSGLAELAVVGISIDGRTTPIDYRSISISGEGGNPLIAEQYGDVGAEIASNDLENALIGALAGAGRELTRPRSESVTNTTFGSTVSRDNGNRNVVGGILQGGTERLADRMGDRNEARLDRIRDRESIWHLPQGAAVEIHFNEDVML